MPALGIGALGLCSKLAELMQVSAWFSRSQRVARLGSSQQCQGRGVEAHLHPLSFDYMPGSRETETAAGIPSDTRSTVFGVDRR